MDALFSVALWLSGAVPHGATSMRHLLPCVLLLAGCSGSDTKRQSPEPSADESSPVRLQYETDLWEAYRNNVAAADLKYTNKAVEFLVRGTVRKTSDGTYYIAGYASAPSDEKEEPNVPCYLLPGQAEKAADAKPRQAFLVRGICAGREDSASAWEGCVVPVRRCKILKIMVWDGKAWK